jgi:hypothetical protein
MHGRKIGRVFRSGRFRAVTRGAMLLEKFLSGGNVGALRLGRQALLRAAGQNHTH